MRRALKAAWCVVVVGMASSAHAQTLEGVSDRHAAAALNRERARAMSDYAEVTEFVVEDETCSRNGKPLPRRVRARLLHPPAEGTTATFRIQKPAVVTVALWQAQTAEELAWRYADKRGCEVKVRRVCPRGWPCGTPGAVETLLRVSKTLGAQTACYDVDTSPFGWEDLSLEFRKGKLVRLTWGHPQGEMGKARRCVEDVIRRTAFPLVDHVAFSHRIYLPRALRR